MLFRAQEFKRTCITGLVTKPLGVTKSLAVTKTGLDILGVQNWFDAMHFDQVRCLEEFRNPSEQTPSVGNHKSLFVTTRDRKGLGVSD